MDEFTEICRGRFDHYVDAMHIAKFHSLKRDYRQRAEAVLDVYLDYLDINGLETPEMFGEYEAPAPLAPQA